MVGSIEFSFFLGLIKITRRVFFYLKGIRNGKDISYLHCQRQFQSRRILEYNTYLSLSCRLGLVFDLKVNLSSELFTPPVGYSSNHMEGLVMSLTFQIYLPHYVRNCLSHLVSCSMFKDIPCVGHSAVYLDLMCRPS